MNILEALKTFEKDNDAHWTADGLPRLDVLKEMTGAAVTRAELLSVARGFSRFSMELETESSEDGVQDEPNSDASEHASNVTDDDADIVVSDPDTEIEMRYRKATENLRAAQLERDEARLAYDEVIRRRTAADAAEPFHKTIKAYQESQRQQRIKTVEAANQAKAILSTLSPEAKALLNLKK